MALTCLAFTASVIGPALPPYKTAGTLPVWRSRRASFLPRVSRGALSTTIWSAFCAMAFFPSPNSQTYRLIPLATSGAKSPFVSNLLRRELKPLPPNRRRFNMILNKQLADRSFFVNRANAARKQVRNAQDPDLPHLLGRFGQGHGIRCYHFADLRFLKPFDRRAGKDRVRARCVNLRGAFAQQCISDLHQRSRGVNNVVHYERAAAAHVTDEVHHFAHVHVHAPFVHDGQRRIEPLRKKPGALHATR